ncbi:dicarboxylate/amino acid:cation symporter [Salibacterium salarium]|uniref:Dicarboxylate/amino acid:cation symporter n=1 Tax=Salibacterium salarium TaxID=284579 RepID=A0A428MX61_9BACI|nr:dicarboxylate/amino acid:cation symporter [Salibacterium salarium]RSL30639.1 dicarboxylate/amino acid:cation symporter [Salibacterium salarium]
MNQNLTKKILYALLFGVITGLILNFVPENVFGGIDSYVLSPVGEIFLNLITMLVVPIVFISISLGTASLKDPVQLGRIGGKTISFYLITTTIALVIGLSLAFVIQPGAEGAFDTQNQEYNAEEAPPIMDTLLNVIPDNPVNAMAEANMLQIIAVAIFFGIALAKLGDKTEGLHKLLEQANEVMMFLVNVVMYTAPYGAFALIASSVGAAGVDGLQQMLMYMVTITLGLVLHAAITYGIAIKAIGKASPVQFFRNFFPAMAVAFSTSSSSGTLPVSMRTAQEKLGISKPVSSFVQPLGATINMDGTAIMQAVATVFIAQVYGGDLAFSQLVMVVLTATLASIGTAGVPGVGLIMLAMVLQQVGLPVEGIAIVLGVDRLLDMLRTSLNITGDAACAYIIDRSEQKKEKENDIESPESV